MRVAGAAAKEMLVAAGAAQFGVPAVRVRGAELARRPRSASGEARRSASSRRRRGNAAGADQPGARRIRTATPSGAPRAPRLDIPVEGGRQRDVRHRLHARRACSTPRSRSRRCTAASWCPWTPAPAEAMPGVKKRREARRSRRRRRRQLLARAQGARRAEAGNSTTPGTATCRPHRSSRPSTRRSARRRRCRTDAAKVVTADYQRAVPRARDDGADGLHGAGGRRPAPRSGRACRIR